MIQHRDTTRSKTLEDVDPDAYVKQPNTISRAIYIMPVMVRRLIFLAILDVQCTRAADMKTTFNLHDLAVRLGFHKTKRYDELKNAINIASKQVLRFENEDGQITEWMPWLVWCKLDIKKNLVTIQINERLYDYVIEIRNTIGFSLIFLSDYIRLESRYACRWFEIISSRAGHAGRDGQFYIRYSIDEIKTIFVINKKQYSNNGNLIIRIVKNPIQEIINRKLGYFISIDYAHQGRKITGVTLRCSFTKREDGTEPVAYYISLHARAYFQCLAEVKKFTDHTPDDSTSCMLEAVRLLKERLGNHE